MMTNTRSAVRGAPELLSPHLTIQVIPYSGPPPGNPVLALPRMTGYVGPQSKKLGVFHGEA
jgi:hypothetical protein